jgi:N-acetylglucosamine malate deacetylase 2
VPTPARPLTVHLPPWQAALAVVAHPDDESFGLGAVLDAFARTGCSVSLLCLTRGEASTVHGTDGDLRTLRTAELSSAAATLGLASAILAEHPDGELAVEPRADLVAEVVRAAAGADGLVVFDPSGVTGHPDHAAATLAAVEAADELGLPVLAWTLPLTVAQQLNEECGTHFVGHPPSEVDVVVAVTRERQLEASRAHVSQAIPTSVLWRRLDLLGDTEHLRWLRPPDDRRS